MTAPFHPPCPGDLAADAAGTIGALAARCLNLELETWPKPGLVSLVDTGSHEDMDAPLFLASAATLTPFFAALAAAGASSASFDVLRRIGLAAEVAMLATTNGVNTHKGAIFGLGLLCAAAGTRAAALSGLPSPLCSIVRERWGSGILRAAAPAETHGGRAARLYGAGGARQEAARGFPSLHGLGLPALRAARRHAPEDNEAAQVQACFALMAGVEDTNLLHRGGPEGLAFAQQSARAFLEEGGTGRPDWRAAAVSIHRSFAERRLSPGGSADLLAMTFFVEAIEDRGGRLA